MAPTKLDQRQWPTACQGPSDVAQGASAVDASERAGRAAAEAEIDRLPPRGSALCTGPPPPDPGTTGAGISRVCLAIQTE
eukprot:7841958-Pyramimonas_sp.AAC.1